jgi:glycogen operon protein
MPALSEPALEAGRPYPLGSHWDGEGINFAVFSAHATALELCLFDAGGRNEVVRLPLPAHGNDVWHGYLRGARPGLVYGYRAHGPWSPERGHRFNPNKLLLDPYARDIVGRFEWRADHFGHDPAHGQAAAPPMSIADNADGALKCRVVADAFDWQGDASLHTPLADTVLYECHVKSLTRRHPDVPEALRGTYAGLASQPMVGHLQALGVTAVSLLPVHQRIDEQRLAAQGLANHWGYNTIGYFAVEPRLASGAGGLSPRDEFRTMVRTLHAAGIEVILDVVYNHTAETDHAGPTICWRGLDNASYYRLVPHDPARYENISGCGNTLDIRHPRVLQMVLDSMRYWVSEMHVDGFRFDLAPVLGRVDHGFDARAPFFQAVAQDPLLARVKLIAEPWDLGHGGYQLGHFPRGWLEWNDRFRDGMRSFWLRHPASRGEFAQRLCGSSDIFHPRNRLPAESVNFITAHDGFTLRDLLTYERKRNEANGEDNRDGHDHNLGWNCGAEGETGEVTVNARRERLQRSLLATLLLSQGTPMLTAGDELGHTQRGNNNAYCQDNGTGWIDWSRADRQLIEFVARAIELRRRWQPFANRWYTGLAEPDGIHDLTWLAPDGRALRAEDWRDPATRALGALIGRPGKASGPLLLLVNAEAYERAFSLPTGSWRVLLDSAAGDRPAEAAPVHGQQLLASHSLVLLHGSATTGEGDR